MVRCHERHQPIEQKGELQLETDGVRVPWQDLYSFVKQVFVRIGMPDDHATAEADAILWANLRGVDSHGVVRIPWYLDNVDSGIMNPNPNIHVISEAAATAFIEADRAFGPVVTARATDMAIKKAKEAGVGWVLIRNHTHQGALGQYPERIAQNGLAGLAIVCAQPNMVPFGASVAGVNNSPIAICVPAKRHPPLLLDMATSVVAFGKLMVAADSKVPYGSGWAVDADGNPTTDPAQFAALLPVGGAKGSGMALLFECLTSVMAANALIQPILSGALSAPGAKHGKREAEIVRMAPHNQNSVITAIDIAHFAKLDDYTTRVDNLIDSMKSLPTADGFEEVLVPGERERQCYADRVSNGIPLATGTVLSVRAMAERFSIEMPGQLQ